MFGKEKVIVVADPVVSVPVLLDILQELERWFQSPEYRGIISRAAASSSVSPAVSGGSS